MRQTLRNGTGGEWTWLYDEHSSHDEVLRGKKNISMNDLREGNTVCAALNCAQKLYLYEQGNIIEEMLREG